MAEREISPADVTRIIRAMAGWKDGLSPLEQDIIAMGKQDAPSGIAKIIGAKA